MNAYLYRMHNEHWTIHLSHGNCNQFVLLYTYCNQVVLFYIHIVISLYFLYKLKCTYICTLNYSIPVVTYIRKYTVGVSIWKVFVSM